MLSKNVLLFFTLFFTINATTRVRHNNYCDQKLVITEETNEGMSVVCKIVHGDSCYKDYTNGWGANFQNGWQFEATVVTVCVSYSSFGYDNYNIWTGRGYDLSVQISSSDASARLLCLDKNCADALNNDNSKRRQVGTNGVVTINWCPDNAAKFGDKELTLVKVIHNSPKIKLNRKNLTGSEQLNNLFKNNNSTL